MTEPPIRVEIERRYDASPESVFDAWLDPARAGRFLFATPEGEMVKVEIDARVGGRFTIVERRFAGEAEHTGVYVAIDRPRLIAFDFGGPGGGDPVRIEAAFAPDGAGCRVTVGVIGVWKGWEDNTREGWSVILDSLARMVGR